jgi:general secretion pathway protein I
MKNNRAQQAGFTLLEVLVAVFVLAIALSSIIAAGSNSARNAAILRDKTLALWVAHNRLTELQTQAAWPQTGDSSDDVTMGGIVWTWHVTVKETVDPTLHRVDIRVQKKQDNTHYNYASLSSFVGSTGKLQVTQ